MWRQEEMSGGSFFQAAFTLVQPLRVIGIDKETINKEKDMQSTKLAGIILACLVTGVILSASSWASSFDNIRFIKIAPHDDKAVIKAADGKLRVVMPGDTIGNTLRVKEIAQGRVVLEENTGSGPETVIVRVENGRQQIERVGNQTEVDPTIVAPVQNESQ
jgi:hypothetical protein